MNIPNAQDYDSLLARLPNVQGNEYVAQQLLMMRNDARVERQPYNFVVSFNALAAGVTAPVASFLVDTSAPFMLVSQQYVCAVDPFAAKNAGNYPVPNATVQIQDQSSNRNWQSAAVPIPTIFGTGERPYFLPQPRLIPANTTVLITVVSTENAQTNDISLVFSGWRYYAVN
jgi:hypothetical protein